MAVSPLVEQVRPFAPQGYLCQSDGRRVMRYPPIAEGAPEEPRRVPGTHEGPPVLSTRVARDGSRWREVMVNVSSPQGEWYGLRLLASLGQVDRSVDSYFRLAFSLAAVTGLAANVSRLAKTLDDVLSENKGDVKTLASELAAASKDLRQLSRLAKESMQPGGRGARLLEDASAVAAVMRRDLPGLTKSAGTTLDGLAAVTGPLTSEDGQQAKLALQRFRRRRANWSRSPPRRTGSWAGWTQVKG